MSFPLYHYRALPIRVVDGDTVVLRLDLGLHVNLESSCRLLGIDAPELQGATLAAGQAAKNWVIQQLTVPDDAQAYRRVWVESVQLDKYGRPLVRIWTQEPTELDLVENSLNSRMVAAGHAKVYFP